MTKTNPFKTKWGQAVDIKLFAFCPICQAMPGSDCRYVGGAVREKSHQDRQVVYQRMVQQYKKATVAPPRTVVEAAKKSSASLTKEKVVELTGCSKCGVDAGHHCKNPNGQKRKKSHFERLQAAQKIFNAGRKVAGSASVIDDDDPLTAQFNATMQ